MNKPEEKEVLSIKNRFTLRLYEKQLKHVMMQVKPSEYIRGLIDKDMSRNN